jgi:hypothetical protein
MAFAALRTPRKAAVNLNLNAFSARAVLLAVVCNLLSGGGGRGLHASLFSST